MEPQSTLDLAEFLGRLHPALVHLPIGLVTGALVVELFGFGQLPPRYILLRRGLLIACALSAALTSASGWQLGESGGYDAGLLDWHRWLSVALAVVLSLAALADCFLSGAGWRRCGLLLALGLVVMTGHQGGSLTHGSNYLTRGTPSWFARMVRLISPASYGGGEEIALPADEDGSEGTGPTESTGRDETPEDGGAEDAKDAEGIGEPARADRQVVSEVLESNCFRCHGAKRSRAGLRLDTRDGVLSVVDPGAAPDSELFRRVTLPEGHGDEMPPDGPPLEEHEIAALRRWINAGAPPLRGAGAGSGAPPPTGDR